MLENPIRFTTLYEFLQGILDVVVAIAFPVIILFLVYIGWLFIQNGDKPEKLKEVRGYFVWAVIGALIVLGAKALSLAIGATVTALGG